MPCPDEPVHAKPFSPGVKNAADGFISGLAVGAERRHTGNRGGVSDGPALRRRRVRPYKGFDQRLLDADVQS